MRTARFRRALDAHPRALLVVLLAFAIEMVPPAAVVEHRHAHGDAPHVHVGRIVTAGRRVATAPAEREAPVAGLHASADDGSHRHLGTPVVIGTLPAVVVIAPPPIVRPLPELVPLEELPIVLQPGRARAPPSRVG